MDPKFSPGQRVRIVTCEPYPSYVGTEAVIGSWYEGYGHIGWRMNPDLRASYGFIVFHDCDLELITPGGEQLDLF